ncbi:Superfamily I DNA and RNA helicase [Gulosibacter molinativorax]|nr:Superfamily I DNA and RNA helicase [Gulosibacter molinativorax]
MNEVSAITAWTLVREVPIPNDIGNVLVAGEQPIMAFATMRDSAVFTNKRIVIRDAQGITGKKVEMYSIPYSSVVMWSSENAGTLDFNAELELWTKAGHLKLKLNKGVDIRKLDHLISSAVLGAF